MEIVFTYKKWQFSETRFSCAVKSMDLKLKVITMAILYLTASPWSKGLIFN